MLTEIEEERKEKTVIWYLGGPSIALRTAGCTAYVDPFFGPSVNPVWTRRFDPLIDPAQIKKANYVLITHEHRDHCNEKTIRALEQNIRPGYVLPAFSMETIEKEFGLHIDRERVHIVKPGDTLSLGNLEIMVFPSADQTATEAVSYLMITRNGKIFHAGDSLYAPSLFTILRKYEPDIALVPLGENPDGWNVYPGTVDFLKMAKEIGARLTVPIHWDLWKESYLDAHRLGKEVEEMGIRVISRGDKLCLPLKS